MVDTRKLRLLVKNFELNSKPSKTDLSELCTIGDLNEVIKSVSKVLNDIIDEVENEQ